MNNKNIKRILGLNVGHDGGCSLCIEGKIVSTMAEERLTRVKYAYGWVNSLKYCLEKAKTKLEEIDLIVFSDYSDKIKDGYDGGLSLFGFPKEKCLKADHHLSHACSVFFNSPFDKSLIFVLDSKGNNNSTESIFVAEGNKLRKIGGNPIANYEKGIVATYQAFTSYFGWHQNDAGKTMGLSSYGNPKRFAKYPLFNTTRDGLYYSNLENHTAYGLEKFCKKNSLIVPQKFTANSLDYKDMAAWVQSEFERAVIGTLKKYQKLTGLKNLCLSGGGALNTVCNTKILKEVPVKNLYIFPAAGDSGQSIGNALYGWYISANNKRKDTKDWWKADYRDCQYSSEEIKQTLGRIIQVSDLIIPKSPKYRFRKLKNITGVTARLISEGKIVGWFQGGSEVGPRALGHRSILCDPRPAEMKDILNKRVKHRETFRPFAASVLFDKVNECFRWNVESPFMLLVVSVKEEMKIKIPAVTHVDGTCRIQTVKEKDNKLYYDVIKEFYKISNVPMILNTSFNLAGEPIVETPSDAIRCFLSTQMDCLILNDFLVEKL